MDGWILSALDDFFWQTKLLTWKDYVSQFTSYTGIDLLKNWSFICSHAIVSSAAVSAENHGPFFC